LKRAQQICEGLEQKGFSSTNVVLGVGSYNYQYVTRDTFGFAIKTTFIEIDGTPHNIFKDPLTDDGLKKSAKGLLRVEGDKLIEETTWESEGGDLETVLLNGAIKKETSLEEIRSRLKEQLI